MAESYSADENDYADDDFEDDEFHEKTPSKRIGTPHSSKKAGVNHIQWDADEDEKAVEGGGGLDVEGQDLESYMKYYSASENNNAANIEDLACELKPLEGVRPKMDNVEEEKLLHKLGYSFSNNSSPVKSSKLYPLQCLQQKYSYFPGILHFSHILYVHHAYYRWIYG